MKQLKTEREGIVREGIGEKGKERGMERDADEGKNKFKERVSNKRNGTGERIKA